MQKFLSKLKKEMQIMNVKDYGFKLAPVYQDITNDKYNKFQEDIRTHKYSISVYDEDEVTIFLSDSEFCYKIIFGTENVWGNYCECHPSDEGYDDDHGCCGDNCDYLNSTFQLLKIYPMSYSSYQGKAKDLWRTMEAIEESNDQVEQKKKDIQGQIDRLQRKLRMLNGLK